MPKGRNKGRSHRQIRVDLKLNYATMLYIIKKQEETDSVENIIKNRRQIVK